MTSLGLILHKRELESNLERNFDGAERVQGSALDITGGPKRPLTSEERKRNILLYTNPSLPKVDSNSEKYQKLHHLKQAQASALQIKNFVENTIMKGIDKVIASPEPKEPFTRSFFQKFATVKQSYKNELLESRFLKSLKLLEQIKIPTRALEENLKEKVDLHNQNIQTLINQLESPDYYKSKTKSEDIKALSETLLPILTGMHEGRRQEDGFLEMITPQIKELENQIKADKEAAKQALTQEN